MAERIGGMVRETPSQTAGPYIHIGCAPAAAGWDGDEAGARFLKAWTPLGAGPTFAEADTDLAITVLDGAGDPVGDALVEIWQADASGGFGTGGGFARRALDASGTGRFRILRPRGDQAFVSVWIAARGINLGLHTRIYFAEFDLPRTGPSRRATMIAQAVEGGFAHVIRLQDTPDGGLETVFLDV